MGLVAALTPNYTPITNADLYTEVIGMRAELRTALQEIAVIKVQRAGSDVLHNDHENRLRRIEADVIRIRVIASTIGTIAGILSGYVSTLIAHAH